MSTSLQAAAPNPKDLARTPGLFGQSVAWLAVAWGVLCVLAGALSYDDLPGMAAMVLVGLAFLIPSLWWLRCASKDRKAVQHYEDTVRTNAYLAQFLTEADQVVIQGMGTPHPPRKTPRHWPGVIALSAVLFIASVILMPVEEDPAPTEPVASTTTSSSVPSTTRSSAALSTTRNTEAEASRSSAAAASRSAEAAAREAAEREAAEREAAERARAEEAARLQREAEEAERARIAEQQRLEQEQQQHQFVAPARAPEPAPAAAYYKNCTAVWNAIGSPIYAGQPGYDSHLDRDGDGIGCERDPR